MYSWGTYYKGLNWIVAAKLKTPPLKELGIEQVRILYRKDLKNEERQNLWQKTLLLLGFALYASLHEYEQAAKWFKQSYPAGKNKEPKLLFFFKC